MRGFIMAICWVVSICAAFPAGAGQWAQSPASRGQQILPLASVPAHRIVGEDRSLLATEDNQRQIDGEPYRFALPRLVDLSPDIAGTWESLAAGDRLWRLRLECSEALSVGLGFGRFHLPPGGKLFLYSASGEGRVLVFDHNDNRDHGQLWTPVLLTDEVVLELYLPAGSGQDWDLQLDTVGWGYRYFGESPTSRSGTCNIDVICTEGDSWREEITTVGVYTIGATWKCTGVMVNNTAQDERPLFLTAFHCGVDAGAAPTVVAYWNYESPVCGQQGGGSLDQFTTGAGLLASYSNSDFTLLELDENPASFGVNFAGWDRSAQVPQTAVCIHHPGTDEKSISFENDPLFVTSYLGFSAPGNSTHLRVADWDLGTTEGGSSGSPLFNEQKLIVGQLHGGYAACDNDLSDWYGRIYTSWTGGGSPETRLSTWLDPLGVGSVSLPLLVTGSTPDPPPDPPAGNARLTIETVAPNPFLDFLEITVSLDKAAVAHARIYDISGRLVADLGGGILAGGESTLTWDGFTPEGARVPAGVYFLVMSADGTTSQKRFVRLN